MVTVRSLSRLMLTRRQITHWPLREGCQFSGSDPRSDLHHQHDQIGRRPPAKGGVAAFCCFAILHLLESSRPKGLPVVLGASCVEDEDVFA